MDVRKEPAPAAERAPARQTIIGRAVDAQRLLADAGVRLAASLDYQTTLQSVARLLVPGLADWCAVDMAEPDGRLRRVVTLHADPEKVALSEELEKRYPPNPEVSAGPLHVLRTGRSEWMAEIPDEVIRANSSDDAHYQALKALGLKAYICVPMEARGQILGTLTLIQAESGRSYTEEDLFLVEELARRAAIAIDNARLYEAAQRENAERRKTEDARRQSEEQFRKLFENTRDAILVADDQGRYVQVNQAACQLLGFSCDKLLTMSLSDLMTVDAPDAGEKYRAYVEKGEESGEFTFVRPDGQRRTVEYVASMFAPGLHMSILRDVTERKAAEERQGFLLEAVRLLSSSLDYHQTLQEVARLAVPYLADYCLFDLVRPDSRLQRVAAAHCSPERQGWLKEGFQYAPTLSEASNPIVRAIHSRQPELEPDVTSAWMKEAAVSPKHLAFLQRMAPVSAVIVPLTVGDRALGALTFCYAESFRRHTAADLDLATELAHRVALAVENARLFEAEKRAHERAADAMRQVQALNEQLKRAMRETHHRVRNNLQIIAGLIESEVGGGEQMVPARELRRIAGHVHALAAVHDLLTEQAKQVSTATDISAREVLEKLGSLVQHTSAASHIQVKAEDIRLTARQGTSLAIVAHELLTNAAKYGAGTVDLRLRVHDGLATLEVADDGPGFPPGFRAEDAANTGLDLVCHIARWDLRAQEIQFGNRPEGGGIVTLTIPLSYGDVPA